MPTVAETIDNGCAGSQPEGATGAEATGAVAKKTVDTLVLIPFPWFELVAELAFGTLEPDDGGFW